MKNRRAGWKPRDYCKSAAELNALSKPKTEHEVLGANAYFILRAAAIVYASGRINIRGLIKGEYCVWTELGHSRAATSVCRYWYHIA